jgi:hypothetical protein
MAALPDPTRHPRPAGATHLYYTTSSSTCTPSASSASTSHRSLAPGARRRRAPSSTPPRSPYTRRESRLSSPGRRKRASRSGGALSRSGGALSPPRWPAGRCPAATQFPRARAPARNCPHALAPTPGRLSHKLTPNELWNSLRDDDRLAIVLVDGRMRIYLGEGRRVQGTQRCTTTVV